MKKMTIRTTMKMRWNTEECMQEGDCMMEERKLKSTLNSKRVLESLWLRYYNAVLFEKGVITESTFKRMEREILNRPSAGKKSG